MIDKIKNFFTINFDNENDPQADKTDGILSLCLLVFCIIIFYLFALLINKTNFSVWLSAYIPNGYIMRIVVNFVLTVIWLIPIYIILRIRRQPLVSIGITRKKTLKSILYGVLFIVPIAIPRIIINLSNGYTLDSPINILLIFMYYFVNIALVEEIYFRGYIFTRIKYYISKMWVRVIAASLLFCVMHIPLFLLSYMNLFEFIVYNAWSLTLFGIFTIFLYSKTNNLLAPIIFHTLYNMLNDIFIIG